VLNLNGAQQNLTVELRIQAAAALEDLAPATLDEMFGAMETVEITPPSGTEPKSAPSKGAAPKGKGGRALVPHIAQVFTTLPERFAFSIDYAPDKIVHCVAPQDPMS